MSASIPQLSGSGARPEDKLTVIVVIVSFFLHALAIGGAIWISLQPPEVIQPKQKPVSAKLIRRGKPRDKKLLPRLDKPSTAQPPPVAAKPPPKPVPANAPKPTQSAPPTQTTVKSAIAKASPTPAKSQASVAQERSRKNREALASATRRQSLFSAFADATAAASNDGASDDESEGDPDGDPEGDVASAEEGERYFGLILARARRYYDVSKSIPPRELIRLKATVILYIGPSGKLLKEPELQTSSGNSIFDQEVLVALKKAAPFGPPPKALVDTLKTVGVAIEATP